MVTAAVEDLPVSLMWNRDGNLVVAFLTLSIRAIFARSKEENERRAREHSRATDPHPRVLEESRSRAREEFLHGFWHLRAHPSRRTAPRSNRAHSPRSSPSNANLGMLKFNRWPLLVRCYTRRDTAYRFPLRTFSTCSGYRVNAERGGKNFCEIIINRN